MKPFATRVHARSRSVLSIATFLLTLSAWTSLSAAEQSVVAGAAGSSEPPRSPGMAAVQSVEAIRAAAVAAALGDAPGDAEGRASVDDHLRLPACAEPLRAVRSGAGVVEVGCASAGWRYVPVRVQRWRPVLVLVRTVAAGERLTAEAVTVETRDIERVGDALADPAAIEGRVARRTLPAGSPLAARDLMNAHTVRRGDIVALIARIGSIEVRASGKALADAGQDDRLSVRNLSSNRVVQGRVNASGEVEVLR